MAVGGDKVEQGVDTIVSENLTIARVEFLSVVLFVLSVNVLQNGLESIAQKMSFIIERYSTLIRGQADRQSLACRPPSGRA